MHASIVCYIVIVKTINITRNYCFVRFVVCILLVLPVFRFIIFTHWLPSTAHPNRVGSKLKTTRISATLFCIPRNLGIFRAFFLFYYYFRLFWECFGEAIRHSVEKLKSGGSVILSAACL